MSSYHLPDPSEPAAVAHAEFDKRRRGFDPMQVRSYLAVVSREMQRLRDRERELAEALDRESASAGADTREFDEARATELLGEETARVLGAARAAAADKLERARNEARDIVEAARAEAAAIRADAHSAVDHELAAARSDGRSLVAEAKLVRERMLDELAVKRHAARSQLEQMRAGRDRLAESYRQIRELLDEVAAALEDALPNAQVAARRVAQRLESLPVPGAASIERELDDAARAGMPLVTVEEIEAELAAGGEEPGGDDEQPAQWVNAGTPPVAGEEIFGEWEEAESQFFRPEDELGRDDLGGDVGEPPIAEPPVAEPQVIVIRDRPRHDLHDGGAPASEPPHEIMLAELTRSWRDVGLPRESVPIVDPPDAVEVVRVLRDGDEPNPVSNRVEPADTAMTAEEVGEQGVPDPVVAASEVPAPRVAEFAPMASVVPDVVVGRANPPGDAEESADAEGDTDSAAIDSAAPVDDLFERIRRTRAAKLAKAEEVLRNAGEATTHRREEAPPWFAVAAPEEPLAAPVEDEPASPSVVVIAEDRAGAAHVDDAPHFEARDRTLKPVQTQIARKLKRLLADEQNDVLDLVRRSHGNIERTDVVPPLDHHSGRYVASIGGELLAAVSAGRAFFGDESEDDLVNLSALDDCVTEVMVAPLRVLLERAVDDAAGEEEIINRVRSAFRETKIQRVDAAARTIAFAAFNAGIEAAHPGCLVRWAVDPVLGCSPDCDDNALEGLVEVGTRFPTGVTRPPAHPGCRCLLVPTRR